MSGRDEKIEERYCVQPLLLLSSLHFFHFLTAYCSNTATPTAWPRLYYGIWAMWSLQGEAVLAGEEGGGLPQRSLLCLLLHRRTRKGIIVAHLKYMSPMSIALPHRIPRHHIHTTRLRGLTFGSRKTKLPKPGRARPVAASNPST